MANKQYSLQAVKAKYLESHPNIPEYVEFTIDDDSETVYRFHLPLFQTNEENAHSTKLRRPMMNSSWPRRCWVTSMSGSTRKAVL